MKKILVLVLALLLALGSFAALDEAVRRAADFVGETIAVTLACGTEPRLGVQLEKTLSHLIS